MIVHTKTGEICSDEQAQALICETIRRTGHFFMHALEQPQIGDVQIFAGLPFRCIRHITYEQYASEHHPDLWGEESVDSDDFFFEVEVAD